MRHDLAAPLGVSRIMAEIINTAIDAKEVCLNQNRCTSQRSHISHITVTLVFLRIS